MNECAGCIRVSHIIPTYKYMILFTINGEQKWLEFANLDILNATVKAFRTTFGKFDYKLIREEI